MAANDAFALFLAAGGRLRATPQLLQLKIWQC
jgi:hypothetical protein